MDPSGSPFILRRARASDVRALLALETSAFPGDRLSLRSLRRHVGSPTADLSVATLGGEVIAYALCLYRKGSSIARLYSIAVSEACRGKGVSTRLMTDIAARARRRACTRLRLEVREDNRPAIHAYEQQGFASFGTIPNYYDDGADAVRMEKPLAATNRKAAA